ncbi:MAG: exodeoxyribonuclease VII large subunit, partial [Duodenibacillus sp.]|nr:exodeoxyribonuclease VII large subunit [Duodenibacillus sp.]
AYLDRLAQRVDGLQGQAGLLMHRRVAQLQAQLAMTQAQLAARRPDFASTRSEVGHAHASLVKAALTQIALRRERLLALDARLQALDMAQVLARGYSIATTVDGRVVRDADELSADQKLELHFSRGTAGVRVESVQTAQKLRQTQKNQRD